MTPEFDPESELHFPLIIVKAIEPGCTTEIQIELLNSGQVKRITTTENPGYDDTDIEAAILACWRAVWKEYKHRQ